MLPLAQRSYTLSLGCMAGAQTRNDSLLRSFTRSLRARNRSPKTIRSYLEAARLLSEHAHHRDLLLLTHDDIEAFLADQLEKHRPTTAAVRFRSLQQFYRWAVTEELIETTPMASLSPPPSLSNQSLSWMRPSLPASLLHEQPKF